MIERICGNSPFGRSQSSAYKDLVWVVATADEESLSLVEQTKQALSNLENSLIELGSSKLMIVSANVFLSDIASKPIMDEVWNEWIGSNQDHWPQRACLGVDLGGHWLIEITVTAVREKCS